MLSLGRVAENVPSSFSVTVTPSQVGTTFSGAPVTVRVTVPEPVRVFGVAEMAIPGLAFTMLKWTVALSSPMVMIAVAVPTLILPENSTEYSPV